MHRIELELLGVVAGGEASSRTDEVKLLSQNHSGILQQWQSQGPIVAMSVVLVQLAGSIFRILSGSEYFAPATVWQGASL